MQSVNGHTSEKLQVTNGLRQVDLLLVTTFLTIIIGKRVRASTIKTRRTICRWFSDFDENGEIINLIEMVKKVREECPGTEDWE